MKGKPLLDREKEKPNELGKRSFLLRFLDYCRNLPNFLSGSESQRIGCSLFVLIEAPRTAAIKISRGMDETTMRDGSGDLV
jgi:hypothetical protein